MSSQTPYYLNDSKAPIDTYHPTGNQDALPPPPTYTTFPPAPMAHLSSSAPSQVFQVCTPGLTSRQLVIKDASTSRTLYDGNINRWGTPSIVLNKAGASSHPNATIGTISFRRLSPDIDCTTHAYSYTMEGRGMFHSGYTYHSVILNENVSWKGRGTTVMEDLQGRALARFEETRPSWTELGKIEILPHAGFNPEQQEAFIHECLTAAIAIMGYRRRRRRRGAAAGGGN